jgi:hypothetical protein
MIYLRYFRYLVREDSIVDSFRTVEGRNVQIRIFVTPIWDQYMIISPRLA